MLRAASYSAPVMHGLREPVKGPPVPSASGAAASWAARSETSLPPATRASATTTALTTRPARILHLEAHGALGERVAGPGLLVELDLHEPAGGVLLDRLLDGRDVDDLP